MNVAPLRLDPTPGPEAEIGVWWLGAGRPPAWLEGLGYRVGRRRDPSALPLERVDLVVAGVDMATPSAVEALLQAIRSRCRGPEVVLIGASAPPRIEAPLPASPSAPASPSFDSPWLMYRSRSIRETP